MNCEQARESIVELIYDELPAGFVFALQEHLTECENCLRYKEEIQQTFECLNQMEDLHAHIDFALLHNAIDRKRHRGLQFLNRRWFVWGTAIVGVCAVIFSIFTLLASEIRYEDNALTIRFR